MFDKGIYQGRRDALKKRIGRGIILLPGHGESPMNFADNCYRFRQDSTFLYYAGISHPDLALVIDCDSGHEILFGDDYTIDQIVWMGSQPSVSHRAAKSGIDATQPLAHLKGVLDGARNQNRPVHFLPPYRDSHRLSLMELMGVPLCSMETMASQALIQAVVDQRIYKSDPEVAEIEKAVNTSVGMHATAITTAMPGMTEARVAAEVERVAKAFDHHLAFPIIATINGQTLHNHDHGNTLKEGQLFLLDAGAETAMGYAGDLSTTFPVAPTFTDNQRQVYEIVLNAHGKAVSMLKPGIPFKAVHQAACLEIANGMKDMGLMKGNMESAVEAGAHAMFFPCGLGHMMGLDVHDMENLGEERVGYDTTPRSDQFGLKSLRLSRKLEKGFVLTVEPGIYFIPELMDLWQRENRFTEFLNYDQLRAYRGFGGIRNEENYLITETGHRLLGKPKPKSVKEVETLRAIAFS
ncbi:MAG: aminopeptidase P N-terminal domain-containing protein [Desulfobacterium sp.]|nr:aminopeptidase P N-terminal domain-containing protein [Desulfobacterium sp.]